MNYQEWAESVPREITGDPLWRVEAYRLALFVAEVGWHDVTKLMRDQRTRSLSDQLYRALGSVSANINSVATRCVRKMSVMKTTQIGTSLTPPPNRRQRTIYPNRSLCPNHASRITFYALRFTHYALRIIFGTTNHITE
jgi:hypothetical protein